MMNTPQQRNPLVWVVDSAYTGELHARIGLAERLGYGYELIPSPNGDACRYQQALQQKYASQNDSPPLLIISGTGEETTETIADLRPLFGRQLFNVYLASILPDQPHPKLFEYDLIASPQLTGDNVVSLPGVPHNLTHATLKTARHRHQDKFNALAQPVIGLLVGGNTRYCTGFDADYARQLAERSDNIVRLLGGSLVITNSRRTPEAALAALLAHLKANYRFYDWRQTELSVYHALLAHAGIFIVTGDSLSMCSEAAFTGKPVLVDISDTATECYHRHIVAKLIDHGAVKRLEDGFEPWRYAPVDPTATIVKAIRQRWPAV